DGDRVCVRIQIRNGLVLGYPASIHQVREDLLSGLIEEVDDYVFPEILEEYFRAEAGAQFPNHVGPIFEGGVVGQTAFQGDGLVLRSPGRFVAGAWISSLAMLDDLSRSFQSADLVHAGDIFAVPLHLELEVLVRIEASWIDCELGHLRPPVRIRGS